MRKTTKKKIAPIVITAAVVLYNLPLDVLTAMSMAGVLQDGPAAVPLLLLYLLLGGAVIFGIILGVIRALLQRLDEIDGGEEEEASRY